MSYSIGLVFLSLLVWGCAQSRESASLRFDAKGKGLSSFAEAGQETYRYAFSGQVLHEVTRDPIPQFSVELVGNDPAVTAVINGMGDARGLFHISRLPSNQELEYASLPLIISAAGYEPVVQMLDLGSDCLSAGCPGVRPTPFRLKPIERPATSQGEGISLPFSPKRLQELLSSKGFAQLFRELIRLGKFDKATETLMAAARNGQELNAIIFLQPSGEDYYSSVLEDASFAWKGGDLVQFASTHSEVANALLAASPLLNYFSPVKKNFKTGGENLNSLLAALFEGSLQSQLASVAALQTKKESVKPQLAMGSLVPLFSQWMASSQDSVYPYYSFLDESLEHSVTMTWVAQRRPENRSNTVRFLMQYLQPLAQRFNSKGGADHLRAFNEFVGKQGLRGLKDLTAFKSEPTLLPLWESLLPVQRGLNSADGKKLAELLLPLLKRNNPGQVIKNIMSRMDTLDLATRIEVVDALFPAMESWSREVVPAKRLLGAQLLAAMVTGELKGFQVTQDLKGLNAVVVRGQSRDLFKLSLLANVSKVVATK